MARTAIEAGVPAVELLTDMAPVFASKGEMRRNVAGLQINKARLDAPDATVDASALLNGRYILVQKGKKNFYIIVAR